MTPKEKAIELFSKFENIKVIDLFHFGMEWHMSQQCALIAVDEIINCTKNGLGVTVYSKEYWEEVKQEIEKL